MNQKPIIDRIETFLTSNIPQLKEENLKPIISKHIEYGTFDVLFDDQEIVAFVTFNLSPLGEIAYIQELVINKQYKQKGYLIIKQLIKRSYARYPQIQYIQFERLFKYPKRSGRLYKIKDFLKG